MLQTYEEQDSTEYIYGHEGDYYETKEKIFENYKLVETTENTKGTMKVTKNEDGTVNTTTYVKYYYVKESAGVVEKHIDIITGIEIETNTYQGYNGDSYKTEAKEFEGYDLVETKLPENAEGIMTTDLIEVKYYYIRKTDVIVEYIDKNTEEKILELVEVEEEEHSNRIYSEQDSTEYIYGHEGDYYETKEKIFENYKLVETTENTKGTMKVTKNEDGTVNTTTYVKYYYVKKSAGVLEKHIDIITGKLLQEEILHEGYEGDSYKIESKELEGYDVVETKLPENSEGTMEKDLIEVKYYYVRKAQVRIEYINNENGKKILEDEIVEGHEGDNYEIKAKKISGYTIIKDKLPKNAKGTMKVTKNKDGTVQKEILVSYYYEKDKESGDINVGNNNNISNTNSPSNNVEKKPIKPNTEDKQQHENIKQEIIPSTGDNVPIFAISIIVLVILLNIIIQINILKKRNKQ